MSRIGKKPIEVPKNVEVKIKDDLILVKGPKGELTQKIHPHVKVSLVESIIGVSVLDQELKTDKALWGLFGSLLRNMIKGVTEGYQKKLIVSGIGYKAQTQGNKLVLSLGFSHEVFFDIPSGINISVDKSEITIQGIDKQKVGDISAQIRALKKPEPYQGKGIRYFDEVIRRKAGKAAAGKTEK